MLVRFKHGITLEMGKGRYVVRGGGQEIIRRNKEEAAHIAAELEAAMSEGGSGPPKCLDSLKVKPLPVCFGPCVYFLVTGNRVVYVGKTSGLNGRVHDHQAKYRKKFDRCYFIECRSDEEAKRLERVLIRQLKPAYNFRE